MANFQTVNLSSITSLPGTPLNADHVVSVKERLISKGVEETPDDFREEAAAMHFEAMERGRSAIELKRAGRALIKEANAHLDEAETLSNLNRAAITRKAGM